MKMIPYGVAVDGKIYMDDRCLHDKLVLSIFSSLIARMKEIQIISETQLRSLLMLITAM